MKRAFVKTAAQQRAIRLLSGPSRFVMLYGGSRSGKTFILVYAILVRALRAAGSRHAILRLHANTVRQSIRFDTLPKVVKLAFPGLGLSESKVDQLIRLPNGLRTLVRRAGYRGTGGQDSRQGVRDDLFQRVLRTRVRGGQHRADPAGPADGAEEPGVVRLQPRR